MQSLRQVGAGFLLGAIFLVIVIGGYALAKLEGQTLPSRPISSPPTSILNPVYPTLNPTQPISVITSTPPFDASTGDSAPSPTVTLSFTPPPTSKYCPAPSGWVGIIVQPYDTLDNLGQTYQANPQSLIQANCLVSYQLEVGSVLYVPPRPAATKIPCGAPAGWINYYILPGDTLFHISQLYRVSVATLQQANCMGSSTYIKAGSTLKVPNVATSTSVVIIPTSTSTSTATPVTSPPASTPTATATALPAINTVTPTVTNTIPVETTVPPTNTQPPTETATPEPSPSS